MVARVWWVASGRARLVLRKASWDGREVGEKGELRAEPATGLGAERESPVAAGEIPSLVASEACSGPVVRAERILSSHVPCTWCPAASRECLLISQALASLRKLKAQRVQPGPPYFKETSSWLLFSGARGHLKVCKPLETLLTTCSECLSVQGNRKVAAQLVVLWQTLL